MVKTSTITEVISINGTYPLRTSDIVHIHIYRRVPRRKLSVKTSCIITTLPALVLLFSSLNISVTALF